MSTNHTNDSRESIAATDLDQPPPYAEFEQPTTPHPPTRASDTPSAIPGHQQTGESSNTAHRRLLPPFVVEDYGHNEPESHHKFPPSRGSQIPPLAKNSTITVILRPVIVSRPTNDPHSPEVTSYMLPIFSAPTFSHLHWDTHFDWVQSRLDRMGEHLQAQMPKEDGSYKRGFRNKSDRWLSEGLLSQSFPRVIATAQRFCDANNESPNREVWSRTIGTLTAVTARLLGEQPAPSITFGIANSAMLSQIIKENPNREWEVPLMPVVADKIRLLDDTIPEKRFEQEATTSDRHSGYFREFKHYGVYSSTELQKRL